VISRRSDFQIVPADSSQTAKVECNPGEVATGGGIQITNGSLLDIVDPVDAHTQPVQTCRRAGMCVRTTAIRTTTTRARLRWGIRNLRLALRRGIQRAVGRFLRSDESEKRPTHVIRASAGGLTLG
jgi:hypothetical protein